MHPRHTQALLNASWEELESRAWTSSGQPNMASWRRMLMHPELPDVMADGALLPLMNELCARISKDLQTPQFEDRILPRAAAKLLGELKHVTLSYEEIGTMRPLASQVLDTLDHTCKVLEDYAMLVEPTIPVACAPDLLFTLSGLTDELLAFGEAHKANALVVTKARQTAIADLTDAMTAMYLLALFLDLWRVWLSWRVWCAFVATPRDGCTCLGLVPRTSQEHRATWTWVCHCFSYSVRYIFPRRPCKSSNACVWVHRSRCER